MMKRRTLVAGAAATGISLVSGGGGLAQEGAGTATPASGEAVSPAGVESGYAPVNGLQMYYEVHGSGGVPVILLHGAYMTIASMSWLLPALAQTRQVTAVEFQGHGHTADVDRPLKYEQLADDVAALMDHLDIAQADIVGYSMGGSVALQQAMRHPDLVRKVVVASGQYRLDGLYPEAIAGIAELTSEIMMGSPWYAEYASVAPNPDDFPILVEKLKRLDAEPFAWDEEALEAITAPTLLIIGDSDVIRPEHTLELFRLLGGGIPGDLTGLPRARLAVLPGTTHLTVMNRIDWLAPMITEFLDEPMPEAG